MMKARNKITITQTNRNPYWKILRELRHRIVLTRKGKGSYKRKSKHQVPYSTTT
jgi:hypothetical protein